VNDRQAGRRPSPEEFVRMGRDFTDAMRNMVRTPEEATEILKTLNNRLRPMGVRVELLEPDSL
jgi:hypothetical protein